MTQGLTQSNSGLCRLCEHRDTPCLESLESKLDARLLSSEYIPSDSEISQLKALLLEEELELAKSQEHVERMTANVHKCRSAISVQQRVPAEIWEIIFCHAIHDYSFTLRHHNLQTPVLTFSHVCARWRAVTAGCSSLWSSIDIDLTAFTSNMMSTLQTYLDRSTSHPLSLSIFWPSPTRVHQLSANARDAWKLLGSYLSRCETLVWKILKDDIFPEVHGFAFSNLISFRYTYPEWPETARTHNWFWRAMFSAPQLTNVVVETPLPFGCLPYSQLTSLDVRDICGMDIAEDLFKVLPKCSALVSLTIRSPDGDNDDIPSVFQTPIEIPTLRHLAIDDYYFHIYSDNTALSIMCPNLLLPNLTSFSIHACGWPFPLSELLGKKCSDTLERLTITLRGPVRSDDDSYSRIITLLQHTPHLTHLELVVLKPNDTHEADTTALLSKLRSLELDRNPFLPRLQSLHLQFPGLEVTADRVEKVLDLASVRHAAETTCTLTHFRLIGDGSCTLDNNARERLRQLRERGIWVGLDNC
ncbi:hypothetical protein PQX77_008015 [Marasmius sp. AFHP31]|nr:hypothetical protein PQX77_008015 [Marasmius sp. AFHP31]